MVGYLNISRKIFAHKFWEEKREFSKFEAWIDLIALVNYDTKEKSKIFGNKTIKWGRGQYPASIRFLQNRWNWGSTKRVKLFLDLLQKENMIKLEKETGQNVITICKYDIYNKINLTGKHEGNTEGNAKETAGKRKGNKVNKDNKDNKDITPDSDESKPVSIHKLIGYSFCQFYEVRFKTKYIYSGAKDGSAVKQLISKIQAKVSEAGMEPSDDNILQGFKHYIESVTDKWVLANFSLSILNSKFNELFKNAKNGNTTNNLVADYLNLIKSGIPAGVTGRS